MLAQVPAGDAQRVEAAVRFAFGWHGFAALPLSPSPPPAPVDYSLVRSAERRTRRSRVDEDRNSNPAHAQAGVLMDLASSIGTRAKWATRGLADAVSAQRGPTSTWAAVGSSPSYM